MSLCQILILIFLLEKKTTSEQLNFLVNLKAFFIFMENLFVFNHATLTVLLLMI